MEETKIKPTIKPTILSGITGILSLIFIGIIILVGILVFFPEYTGEILTGVIFSLIGFLPILIFMGIFGFVGLLINQAATTYTLSKNNEITIDYSFLNSTSKVYRADQITSLELFQTFFEKKIGAGSIKMGIFGKNSLTTNNNQQNQQQQLSPRLNSIPDARNAFNSVAKIIGVEFKDSLYSTKPITGPAKFNLFISVLLVIAYASLLPFIYKLFSFESIKQIFVSILPLIILVLMTVGNFVKILKLKKTTYSFSEKTLYISYNYLFSRSVVVIPYHKITNFKVGQNLISYGLFGTSNVQIYTGGNNDPILSYIKNDKEISSLLSYIVKNKESKLTKEKINNLKKNIEKPIYSLKPGKSFIFSNIIFVSILTIIILVIGTFLKEILLATTIIIAIIILFTLPKILQWKNVKYDLYENKIFIKKGIISITKEEIDINNIKYLRLHRGPLSQKMLGEGNIIIYTSAGTLNLNCVPKYKYYYDEITQTIIE